MTVIIHWPQWSHDSRSAWNWPIITDCMQHRTCFKTLVNFFQRRKTFFSTTQIFFFSMTQNFFFQRRKFFFQRTQLFFSNTKYFLLTGPNKLPYDPILNNTQKYQTLACISYDIKTSYNIMVSHAKAENVAWVSVAWVSVAWVSVAWVSVAWVSVAWVSVAWVSVRRFSHFTLVLHHMTFLMYCVIIIMYLYLVNLHYFCAICQINSLSYKLTDWVYYCPEFWQWRPQNQSVSSWRSAPPTTRGL